MGLLSPASNRSQSVKRRKERAEPQGRGGRSPKMVRGSSTTSPTEVEKKGKEKKKKEKKKEREEEETKEQEPKDAEQQRVARTRLIRRLSHGDSTLQRFLSLADNMDCIICRSLLNLPHVLACK